MLLNKIYIAMSSDISVSVAQILPTVGHDTDISIIITST